MKRVLGLTVLLISTYIFEFLFLYPGNVVDEISYYKPTSQISVTNTTIYNEDIIHYYKVVKQLKEADFESLEKSIAGNDRNLLEDYSKSIDLLISEININLLFHNFTKFKESNNGLKGIYVNGYYMNKETKMNSIKEILNKTNVNTLVIDAKTDNGHVLFDSQSSETDILKNERIKYDAASLQELRLSLIHI